MASQLRAPAHSDEIKLSFPQDHVLLLTLNRPKSLNAVTPTMTSDIKNVLDWFDSEPSLWYETRTSLFLAYFCVLILCQLKGPCRYRRRTYLLRRRRPHSVRPHLAHLFTYARMTLNDALHALGGINVRQAVAPTVIKRWSSVKWTDSRPCRDGSPPANPSSPR